ncbi:MAG: LysR family transcriptional regulator [Mesorhizobium sp.]|uniref:LysR substrate-binding domain-containing protein n=1 Tax=Mesorhizobium sp. TaxID=1871066 RepID=UPI001AC2A507|nr:LysR substrate-binding domain-containing protein [Mesorhizobium sp.]MBN9219503.1 LysR family transcriptional regulator [Mesorhizobium sp.]
MDSVSLRFFEAVARSGAMNRAAEALNTVQSNVTARMKALEEELGVALFRRHSRGVELTSAGERLLPYALKSVHLMTEARRSVLDEGLPKGRLSLGSLETTAALRLSPLLSRYGTKYPEVDLSLKVGANDELIRRVLDYELDGAFVCGPVQHPQLLSSVAFQEELVIASPANVPLERHLAVGCRVLVKGQGCAYRNRLDVLLAQMGIQEVARLEFGTLDAIIGCLEGGLGITLLPRSLLQAAADAGRVRLTDLSPEAARVQTLFIRRRDVGQFSALSALLAELSPEVPASEALPMEIGAGHRRSARG